MLEWYFHGIFTLTKAEKEKWANWDMEIHKIIQNPQ